MGGCCSSASGGDVEQKKRSQMIDKGIEDDMKRLRRECKILLLGSGESGKSTIVKQMKIIHQNGYSVEELTMCRSTVYKNLLDCAKDLIGALHHFELQPSSPKVKEYMEYLNSYQIDPDPNTPIDPKVGDAVTYLWNDPIMPTVLEHQNEFYLMDSAPYFFDEAKRITAPDYIPNEADVLRARTKTTGIYETRFTMGQLSIQCARPTLLLTSYRISVNVDFFLPDFSMFDVGGQRSERKKWIHCFENVTSIIFCVALSEYDQVLLEESNQNRMMESLVLFDSVVNSRWFMRTSIILFLNKVDLFRQKLGRSPLNKYFPDYSGGNDVNRAAKYLLWRFNQVNRAHLNLYPHLTQATDTSNIRLVFAAVKETILQNALKDSGIL
ncbi:guanine nucleotide-binding protein alpha-3 subunit [Blastomyces percursus]|uniref:Guanine nucleotide-binding protein alpha-3 subunit n=2 Tax=Blastomyces TaxID=229219 RepID=A0A1J9R1F2_9EURO|nr:guanine nucleotide-binding protein alpha-3 subunit [Blastomyces percursus]